MVSEIERACGFKAYRDIVNPPDGVEYMQYGYSIPEDAEGICNIGTVAFILTEGMSIQQVTDIVQTTNRAVAVGQKNSPSDQRRFMQVYKEFMDPLQKAYRRGPDPEDPDEPDAEEAIVARASMELAQKGVVTLAGFIAVEYEKEGELHPGHGLFCADAVVQALALAVREDCMEIGSNLEKYQPSSEGEEQIKARIEAAVHHGKTMSRRLINDVATDFAANALPTSNELRKHLGFAPPKRKKRK